jgi:hypothetical protein
MKRKSLLIGSAIAVALAAGAFAYGSSAAAQPYGGWGMMGPGYGYMHGPGMMHGYGPGPRYGRGPGYGPRGGYGACPGYGPGMMGPGYGPGWMHRGRGYGPGYGRHMWGPGAYSQQSNLNLSVDDVKSRLERWLTWRGNSRLKVGEVKEKDANTIVADIVTKDNSLVQRFIVERKTGIWRRDEG